MTRAQIAQTMGQADAQTVKYGYSGNSYPSFAQNQREIYLHLVIRLRFPPYGTGGRLLYYC